MLKLNEKKKKTEKKEYIYKFEPFIDNMDLVLTSQSPYFQKYIDFEGHDRDNRDPIWTGYRVISIWCPYSRS